MAKSSVAVLNWKRLPYTYIGREQYNALLESLRSDPTMEEIPRDDCKRPARFHNTFQVIPLSYTSSEIRVMCNHGEGMDATRFKYMNSNETVDEQNDNMSGGAAYDILDDMFAREHGLSIFRAYTGRKYKDLFKRLKACVPSQPHYARRTKEVLDQGYKADVSSCFPSELAKPLPTLNGCKLVPGRQKPTDEFPFAFYLNSHHMEIKGEFNTRELRTRWYVDYYATIYDDLLPESQDETLLCPVCKYSFAKVMRELYNGRNHHAENKDVMNKTIGVFHYNGNPRLAHVAAVVLARCVYHMNLRADILTSEGNTVYHIATDSILWRGKLSPIVCSGPKDMGKFMLEEKNVRFFVRSTNCYQFEREDGTVITRFSGNVPKEIKEKMRLGDVEEYKEEAVKLRQYYRDKNGYFLEADNGK